MHQFEDRDPPNRRAWIPMCSLVTVALIGAILHSGMAVVDLFGQCAEVISLHDPEVARYTFSPWLEPYFETADDARRLPRDVSIVVNGRHRYFVAYRLAPRDVFLDEPAVIDRLRGGRIEFAKIEAQKTDLQHGEDRKSGEGGLFLGEFEEGHADDWSENSKRIAEESR